MSDSDVHARAGELVAHFAAHVAAQAGEAGVTYFALDSSELATLAALAAAGLELRADLGSMRTNSFNAQLAYDLRIRHILGDDAGAVAGEGA